MSERRNFVVCPGCFNRFGLEMENIHVGGCKGSVEPVVAPLADAAKACICGGTTFTEDGFCYNPECVRWSMHGPDRNSEAGKKRAREAAEKKVRDEEEVEAHYIEAIRTPLAAENERLRQQIEEYRNTGDARTIQQGVNDYASLESRLAAVTRELEAVSRTGERWHELWAQDQRYSIWENTPEGQATHWAVDEEECALFASDAFDADKMRDDLREAESEHISALSQARAALAARKEG